MTQKTKQIFHTIWTLKFGIFDSSSEFNFRDRLEPFLAESQAHTDRTYRGLSGFHAAVTEGMCHHKKLLVKYLEQPHTEKPGFRQMLPVLMVFEVPCPLSSSAGALYYHQTSHVHRARTYRRCEKSTSFRFPSL